MEAAKEIGANGLGIGKNGMMTHISQMMVERVERGWNGGNPNDILGSSVQSALRAAKEALYDLDHPLAAGHAPVRAILLVSFPTVFADDVFAFPL